MAITVQHVGKSGALLSEADYEAADQHTVAGDVDGTVPVGGIIMWSGAIAEIPTPVWELCDGTANAPGPDLRDKFIVGATQDDAGVAKTNIEGVLRVSATQTGASLAGHAALTHANGTVADHANLTHDGAVASHPDLTHAALSHPAVTVVHADHSLASASHTHASGADVSVPSGSFASTAGVSVPSGSVSHASVTHSHAALTLTQTLATVNTGHLTTPTATSRGTVFASTQTRAHPSESGTHASQTGSIASVANASAPSGTIASTAGASRPSLTGSLAAQTVTHADHSIASLSHQAIGTHAALTHDVTPPAAHGTAGTLTHAFTQPDNHAISAHGTVAIVPAYYALAFIQRMN